jgi:hypothetical protein
MHREVADGTAQGSFDEAVATLERTKGAHTVKRQAGEIVAREV